jgi:hypothetical protein
MGAKIQQSVCVQVLQPRRFAGTQPLRAFGVALQLNLGLALVDSQWPSNFLLQHHCTQIKYWNFAAKYWTNFMLKFVQALSARVA